MPQSTYKVIELIGTSEKSWEEAAKIAVERAAEHLRELRVAEVVEMDMVLADGKVLTNLFTPAFAQRPVATVPTHDDPEQKPVEQTESKVDEQALEHLRSLGYID